VSRFEPAPWVIDSYTTQYDDATTPRAIPGEGDVVHLPHGGTPDGRELDAFMRRMREGAGVDAYLEFIRTEGDIDVMEIVGGKHDG